jgi:hypothetical protein
MTWRRIWYRLELSIRECERRGGGQPRALVLAEERTPRCDVVELVWCGCTLESEASLQGQGREETCSVLAAACSILAAAFPRVACGETMGPCRSRGARGARSQRTPRTDARTLLTMTRDVDQTRVITLSFSTITPVPLDPPTAIHTYLPTPHHGPASLPIQRAL